MKIKSITDVITNSSTEVFIVKRNKIHQEDLKIFDIYKSKEEIYKIAENYNNEDWKSKYEAERLIENIYRYIIYLDPTVNGYDIQGLLKEYTIGPLAEALNYTLVDVLKILEPIWIKSIDYGFLSFADDCGSTPNMKGDYEMIDRI